MAVSKKDGDIFSKSGPFHFTTSINWSDLSYQTAVAASLVKGVSVLQRLGDNEAKPWWESFHFTLSEQLINEDDNFIYGAIFEYQYTHLELSPRYVIAFRGTILSWKTALYDMILDIRIAFDKLHRSSRVVHAVQKIKTVLDKHKNSKDVWLVGHSLGAAIALLAGKTMIGKSGISLETYAFNPPISAIPLNQITNNDMLKTLGRITWSFFKDILDWGEPGNITQTFRDKLVILLFYKLARIITFTEQNQEDHTKIASWIPHLYVNPKDLVCSEFIGIFSHKKLMSVIRASKTEIKAARNTFRSRFFRRKGPRKSSSSDISTERLHILPSAYMIINMMDEPTKFEVAHGLHQWWVSDADERKIWKIEIIRPTIDKISD